MRVAATASLNAWFDELTLVPLVEQEFLSTALATENPNLRVEVSLVCMGVYMCVLCVDVHEFAYILFVCLCLFVCSFTFFHLFVYLLLYSCVCLLVCLFTALIISKLVVSFHLNLID